MSMKTVCWVKRGVVIVVAEREGEECPFIGRLFMNLGAVEKVVHQ